MVSFDFDSVNKKMDILKMTLQDILGVYTARDHMFDFGSVYTETIQNRQFLNSG